VVVAVVPVRVVQVPIDQVVGVVAVRDGLVTASGSVPVVGTVAPAIVVGGAVRRVGRIDGELVLVDVLFVRMVQVPVVEVVGVALVPHRRVPAARPVLVRVRLVGYVCHVSLPPEGEAPKGGADAAGIVRRPVPVDR
jgi:hypothetical protein